MVHSMTGYPRACPGRSMHHSPAALGSCWTPELRPSLFGLIPWSEQQQTCRRGPLILAPCRGAVSPAAVGSEQKGSSARHKTASAANAASINHCSDGRTG